MNIIPPTVKEVITVETTPLTRSLELPQEVEKAYFYNCDANPAFVEYIHMSKFLEVFGKRSKLLSITATKVLASPELEYDTLIAVVQTRKQPKIELLINNHNKSYKDFLFIDAVTKIETLLGLRGFLRVL